MNLSKKFAVLLLTALFSASLSANCFKDKEQKLTSFLKSKYSNNPKITNLKIDVIASKDVPNSYSLWKGYKVKFSGMFNRGQGQIVPFSENQVFFTDGCNFTDNLTSTDGEDWKTLFEPKIEAKHYSATHRISGNASSKYKIVIFSDPLCPYCQRSVPPLLDYVKNYPKTFAVYYYHLPLESIHPAAVPLTRLMYIAQIRGQVDAISKAYFSKVSSKERDEKKVVDAFNSATGLKYTVQDVNNALAIKSINSDRAVANELDVRGTPTIYLDGKKVHGDFYKDIQKVDK
jgi:thiol:disulfide interchange protein DsbC